MSNTTFASTVTAHESFDPSIFWASVMTEWDQLPDLFLDLGDIALSDFFIEMTANAAWISALLVPDTEPAAA